MSKIAIIANGPVTRDLAPAGFIRWGLAWRTYQAESIGFPRDMDLMFECHSTPVFDTSTEYWQWCIDNAAKLIYRYDMEHSGRDYFTSSIALMIAHAIEQQPKTIGLYGLDSRIKGHEEYGEQYPCIMYWIGIAEAKGIEIIIPEICGLFVGDYGKPESSTLQPCLDCNEPGKGEGAVPSPLSHARLPGSDTMQQG